MAERTLVSKSSEAKYEVPLSRLQKPEHTRSIKSSALQAKLRIGQPNDIYEQEADRAAEQIMRMPDPVLQRRCAKCNEDEKKVLQNKKSSGQATLTREQDVPPIVQDVLRSPGQPLDSGTRAFMEPRFGYDFSGVRVHTDAKAAESAKEVGSWGYTVGTHVVLDTGSQDHHTLDSKKLLAHELTHVVQQTASSTPSKSLQRKVNEGETLESNCLKNQPTLESCFHGEHRMLIGEQDRDAVQKVQYALISNNYEMPITTQSGATPPDGKYGKETERIVTQFKTDQGIYPNDGVVGPRTIKALDDSCKTKSCCPQIGPSTIVNPPNICKIDNQAKKFDESIQRIACIPDKPTKKSSGSCWNRMEVSIWTSEWSE